MRHDVAKRLFPALCEQNGLPRPVPEYRFHPVRKWRFDYGFTEHKLALEVEGAVWTNGRHTRGSGFVADMEKYNSAASMGWRLLRVTPSQLCMMETLHLIKQSLEITHPRPE